MLQHQNKALTVTMNVYISTNNLLYLTQTSPQTSQEMCCLLYVSVITVLSATLILVSHMFSASFGHHQLHFPAVLLLIPIG
jgi:hypothetical protein